LRPLRGNASIVMHSPYTPEAIKANLHTLILGHSIELHQQVTSTNDLARGAGRKGEPEGLVILAEEQVRGRGRLGRAWTAPPGSSILCSVLLRPRFPSEYAFYLTIAASLAIYRGIRDWGSGIGNPDLLIPSIKWPNDVLLNGRKVAGVLCESEFAGREWGFSIVGFGINVNLRPTELGEVAAKATSLSAELGMNEEALYNQGDAAKHGPSSPTVDRSLLLAGVLGELESLYLAMQNGQFGGVFREWVSALETPGRRVSVRETGGVVNGMAVRVDPDGALVIRTDGGAEKRVLAGDIVS
jgi:BirA family transcriptional regulator, biotin operon repressor / biotin---[acetyl-CoA-carboxylase] ligase